MTRTMVLALGALVALMLPTASAQISRVLGVTAAGNPEKTNYGKC